LGGGRGSGFRLQPLRSLRRLRRLRADLGENAFPDLDPRRTLIVQLRDAARRLAL